MKSGRKQQIKAELIGIDLGNGEIRVRVGRRSWQLHHTLYLQNKDVYLSRKQSHHSIMDVVYLLGTNFARNVDKLRKYYNYCFNEGHNHSTLLIHSQSQQEKYHLEMYVALIMRGIVGTNPVLRLMVHERKPIRLVVTVFEGQYNPYRLSLQHSLQIAGLENHTFVTTSHCIAARHLNYSQHHRDHVERIAVIDFGDSGMAITIYKLYSMQRGVVEVVDMDSTRLGGLHITSRLVDFVASELMRSKGMDINQNPKLMHKLKILCLQAKHTLAYSDRAFVRLDELPDIRVFGSQVSLQQFQDCIMEDMNTNFDMIRRYLNKDKKISKIITTGGSCDLLLFQKKMNELMREREKVEWVKAEPEWASQGILLVKGDTLHLMDLCPFEITIEGDENFKQRAVVRGEAIPLRKKIPMRFPSGQLTFSMRFYQDGHLIGWSTVPERPRENSYSLYVQVDHNKVVSWYTTTSFGLISMNTNKLQLKTQEYLEYCQMVPQFSYHLENQ